MIPNKNIIGAGAPKKWFTSNNAQKGPESKKIHRVQTFRRYTGPEGQGVESVCMNRAPVKFEMCFEHTVVDVSPTITDSQNGRRIEPINKTQMVSTLT